MSRRKLTYPERISQIADLRPNAIAVTLAKEDGSERQLAWGDLDSTSNQVARMLSAEGVDETSLTVIGLPNSLSHYVWTIAAWKLGSCTLSLSPSLPTRERDDILDLAKARVVISDWDDVDSIPNEDIWRAIASYSPEPLPNLDPDPARAVASGGSTGRSKIIVLPGALGGIPGDLERASRDTGFAAAQVQLIAGPLYHNMPHGWGFAGLFQGHHLIVMERFDAGYAVDLIERHAVNFAAIVPTHMQRIAKLPGVEQRDFSSIQAIVHSAAVCPEWVKDRWIALLGADKVFEAYGSTENVGHTAIRGDEWLEHRGSVGQPRECELRILDEALSEVAAGTVGEIFMRPENSRVTHRYLGSKAAKSTPDGFTSVGDLGWVDEDGYLFIADRRTDLIISGGVNIYPAEVEAVLSEHPGVSDVAVIGLPDEDWGQRVHAIAVPTDLGQAADLTGDLLSYAKQRLSAAKVPKSVELVQNLPRNDAGKIRRKLLREERQASVPGGSGS